MDEISHRNENVKEHVILDEWKEIMGEFVELNEKDNLEVSISIQGENKKLVYPKKSKESRILKDELRDIEKGSKIGILRTDLDERPICIRKMK